MPLQMRKIRLAILVFAFALAPNSSAAPDAQTPFSFTLSDVRLDANGQPAFVELHGDHLNQSQMKAPVPSLTDTGKSPAVTFVIQGERPQGDNARIWVYLATAAPKLDPDSALTRQADLKIDGADWFLAYILTNKPAAPPVLTASAGNRAWAIWWDHGPTPRYEILLSVTAATAQHVRLASSGIKNTKSPDSINDFDLCDDPQQPTCAGKFDISPGISRTLYLRPHERSREGPYGFFSGDVKFAGDGIDTPASLTIDVSVTSAFRRGIGIFAIAAGVLTSLILIVAVRARALRIEAEIPVVALRETVEKTIAAASHLPLAPDIDYTPVRNRLQDELAGISGRAIDALLPPQVLPAFPGTGADNSATLKTLLETTGHVTAAINILVTQSMQPVAAQFPADPTANAQVAAAVRTALNSLIQAATTVATESDASTQLTQILANFERAKRPPAAAQAVGANPIVLKEAQLLPQTVHQLQYKLDWLSLIVWVVWAAITIALGYVVLIDSSPGFGTWSDIILCAAWGLGINVAGDAVKSLTPSSISTGLGITLPKANS